MKGFIVDCKLVVRVKDLMEVLNLPTPRKRVYLKGDGELLPLIIL